MFSLCLNELNRKSNPSFCFTKILFLIFGFTYDTLCIVKNLDIYGVFQLTLSMDSALFHAKAFKSGQF